MNSQIGVSSVHVIVSRSEGGYWKAGVNEFNQAHIRGVFNAVTLADYFFSRPRHPVSHDGRNRTPYSGLFHSGLHFLFSFFERYFNMLSSVCLGLPYVLFPSSLFTQIIC
jgi:hypothetical protein